MMHTVVVLEAGIGAISLGFTAAGFQVVAAFEKDKKAVELYKRNINDEVCEYGLMDLSSKQIPDADVIAVDLMSIPSFKRQERNWSKGFWAGDVYLNKVCEIIKGKNPLAFCFVMGRTIYKNPVWTKFLKELSGPNYNIVWKVINTREVTGFPVTEERVYVIGSRVAEYGIQISETEFTDQTVPFKDFVSCAVEDRWYYRVDKEKIQENVKDNCLLCWRKDKYVERSYVDWNLMKPPLVKVDGIHRKLTHREMARLKGFPENFDFDLSNKAWLYRMLVYAPNVQVVKRVAAGSLLQPQTPLRKMQMVNSQKFEKLFRQYLKQQGGEIQESSDYF